MSGEKAESSCSIVATSPFRVAGAEASTSWHSGAAALHVLQEPDSEARTLVGPAIRPGMSATTSVVGSRLTTRGSA